MSIGSGGATNVSVETLLASFSYLFGMMPCCPGNEGSNSGAERMVCGPLLVTSVPSTEESKEVARDLAEKEVFVDVPADEALVAEGVVDVLFSNESRDVEVSQSIPSFCARCFGFSECDFVLAVMEVLSGGKTGTVVFE